MLRADILSPLAVNKDLPPLLSSPLEYNAHDAERLITQELLSRIADKIIS